MAAGDLYFQVPYRSVVRGFYVYKAIWNPVVNEELSTAQEPDNPEDRYAISVIKDEAVVGHVPRELSRISYYFIQRNGEILCTVTGNRLRSVLVEGGLEIPCIYTFRGKKKLVDKLKSIMSEMHMEIANNFFLNQDI